VTNTAKGVAISAKYVYNSGKDVVTGMKEDDMERAKLGAKHLLAAAAVTTLAVGVVDAVDGVEGVETAESD
jgi:hypothetical protein